MIKRMAKKPSITLAIIDEAIKEAEKLYGNQLIKKAIAKKTKSKKVM